MIKFLDFSVTRWNDRNPSSPYLSSQYPLLVIQVATLLSSQCLTLASSLSIIIKDIAFLNTKFYIYQNFWIPVSRLLWMTPS
ncbi:MAG: hypothetical protein ACR5K9_06460 [Wolbachia sp.]